ncbi:hypothetical protein D9M69_482270 [compost metagenome]
MEAVWAFLTCEADSFLSAVLPDRPRFLPIMQELLREPDRETDVGLHLALFNGLALDVGNNPARLQLQDALLDIGKGISFAGAGMSAALHQVGSKQADRIRLAVFVGKEQGGELENPAGQGTPHLHHPGVVDLLEFQRPDRLHKKGIELSVGHRLRVVVVFIYEHRQRRGVNDRLRLLMSRLNDAGDFDLRASQDRQRFLDLGVAERVLVLPQLLVDLVERERNHQFLFFPESHLFGREPAKNVFDQRLAVARKLVQLRPLGVSDTGRINGHGVSVACKREFTGHAGQVRRVVLALCSLHKSRCQVIQSGEIGVLLIGRLKQ